jgi:hypothetical protein
MRTTASISLSASESSGIPAWLPEQGQYGKVPMQNKLADLRPPTSSAIAPPGYTIDPSWTWGAAFMGQVQHFSGAGFAKDFSPLGAWFVGCGGGNSWWGNNIAIGDLSALSYSLLIQPSPYALAADYNSRTIPADVDWRDYPDFSPLTSHNYTSVGYMPPEWGVTEAKGAFFKTSSTWNNNGVFAHRCDFASPLWQRHSTTVLKETFGLAPYPAATRDDARRCFYWFAANQGGTSARWQINADGSIVKHTNGGIGVQGLVTCAGYAPPPYDVVLSVGGAQSVGGARLRIRHPDAWSSGKALAYTGTPPSYTGDNGAHPEWDADRGCFAFWDPVAEIMHMLYPPPQTQDAVDGTWRFVQKAIGRSVLYPPVKATSIPGGQWNKLRRIPALRAFVYVQDEHMHIIRPTGA